MSGTSLDGIDAALVTIEAGRPRLRATHSHALPDELRQQLMGLCDPGDNEIHRAGRAHRELGAVFAEAINALLAAAGIPAADVHAIGCHGQTVRHEPGDNGFSLQLGSPDVIAVNTAIPVVADFRNKDMVLGGQGAPLAPRFHQQLFARDGERVAVVNIGGMANPSLLDGTELQAGFDTGPGNALLNGWCQQHTGEPLDRDGAWARRGQLLPDLLARMLEDPYFQAPAPKSTGREYFNAAWLEQFPEIHQARPEDVQATLTELTARTIADGLSDFRPHRLLVCGGGAHNGFLMERLQACMADIPVADTSEAGMPPDWIEAAAFAWLAWARLNGVPGNAPAVTGAARPAVLGAVYRP